MNCFQRARASGPRLTQLSGGPVGPHTIHQIVVERRRLGITSPTALVLSATRPKLLAVTTSADKAEILRRQKISRAHGLGFHDDRYVAGCTRCEEAAAS